MSIGLHLDYWQVNLGWVKRKAFGSASILDKIYALSDLMEPEDDSIIVFHFGIIKWLQKILLFPIFHLFHQMPSLATGSGQSIQFFLYPRLHYWAKTILNMLLYNQPSWYCTLLVKVGHLSSLDEALYSSNDRTIWCQKNHLC